MVCSPPPLPGRESGSSQRSTVSIFTSWRTPAWRESFHWTGFTEHGMGCLFASHACDTYPLPAPSAEEWPSAYPGRSDFVAMQMRLQRLVTGHEMDSRKTQLLSELLPTADPVLTQPRIARISYLHMLSCGSRSLCHTASLEASKGKTLFGRAD
jgi:hypothetical protein